MGREQSKVQSDLEELSKLTVKNTDSINRLLHDYIIYENIFYIFHSV